MTVEDFWLNFLYSLLATLVGGFILAFLFFLIRERVFPPPKIAGRWFFETTTLHTAYNPYKDMRLRYMAMLWNEGNYIKGTVEKIYENSSTGERCYEEKNRRRGFIDGCIVKNYFSKDRVDLHLVVNDHGRESTYFFDIVIKSNSKMTGSFTSMVANQNGNVTWQRERF